MADKLELETIRKNLATWFAKQLPAATDIAISPLKMPGAGSSNETFFMELQWREEGNTVNRSLVIRWKPKGFLVFPEDSYDMHKQYQLQKCLAATPVPVPPVYWLEQDPAVIGAPFYIMERVDGWIPGDFPPYHAQGTLFEATEADRARTWLGAVATIAKIHALDWRSAGLDFLAVPEGSDFISEQVAFWDRVFSQNDEPMPEVLATARQWLLENRFEPECLTLCWGDARPGNMIFQGYDVAAVLDWEMACIGDPESDLAWFAHIDWLCSAGRSTGPLPRLSGLPGTAETIDHYERLTGRNIKHFHYYDVFATWRMAIVYTRIEQDEKYLTRSGNRKGFITRTQFEKLRRILPI